MSITETTILAPEENGNDKRQAVLDAKVAAMKEMVAKYSQDILSFGKPHTPRTSETSQTGQIVVLTGSTGRLGCHLLAQLAEDPQVKHIYALNREASGDVDALFTRHTMALGEWGLEPTLLRSSKITLLVCNYNQERLGLDEDTYERLAGSATSIIHNAWRLHLKAPLSEFEPLIASLRNIVGLAVRSSRPGGAKIVFVSSVSVLANFTTMSEALERPITDPCIAAAIGYGESKWVAEQLLLTAREVNGIDTTIVRVGQLTGDSRIGAWSTKEWLPGLVAISLKVVGALPDREGDINWLPVDVAAKVLVEMMRSNEPVLHLVSPRPVACTHIITFFASRLKLPLMPYQGWIERLHTAVKAQAQVQADGSSKKRGAGVALTLFELFRDGHLGIDVVLSLERALKASPSLARAKSLDEEDVERYIAYWQKTGLLSA
ncbi:male sterility protein-domain-containing protein [Vararia minispora EC-137]|uniref:Male sterility protein-domain-containing protein n=1 Tax=Vararia minispora EC-137 TaxID=1314806 RepID=A0ACB8QQC4_9AGAM|nr:male sterility protein-domain-containing protein [Vararia minispora EC-137]